jgi:hypothetical protein
MLLAGLVLALRLSPDSPAVPLKQPQIAVSGDTIALTYGAGSALFFASSRDGGKTFLPAVKVAEVPFTPLGMRRGPRIAFAGRNLVIAAITGTTRGKDGDVVAWRSTDSGKTWSAAVKVSDVPAAAREGLHALAGGPGGTLLATWLDLRANSTKLFGAISKDGGGTWGANIPIYESPDGHICECCHPTAYIAPGGRMYAMWRNWLGGARDMYLASSADGGRTWKAEKLGEGAWPLKGCPMDGGGLAVDQKGGVHTAWRREGTVYYAQPGEAETLVGSGKNPMIAAAADEIYVAYNEGSTVKLRSVRNGDTRELGKGANVVLAGAGPVYAAWEDDGAIHVERVDRRKE